MPSDLPPSKGPAGPLKMMLESLDLPDLIGLRDAQGPPKGQPGHVPGEVPVPGFICASDPNAIAGRLRAPVSYRASTGDSQLGDNGAFAPGRSWSLAAIEARDGLSCTAAFAEAARRPRGRRPGGPGQLPDRLAAPAPRRVSGTIGRERFAGGCGLILDCERLPLDALQPWP